MDCNEFQLRGYIPLSAPLNWEPMVGDESPLRTVLSFTVNWFTKRVGIDFSEQYHLDPVFRFESLLKMKDYIKKAFPQISYFREHDKDGYEQECATLSGVFGVCLVAMIYGLKPTFYKNNWPALHPNNHLSVEEIKNLRPFDLSNNPVVEQLFHQMDTISENWGKIDGYPNYQGVLNNAFKIRGTEIFLDILDDPGLSRFLFDHITNTMIDLIQMVQQRQRESGFYINSLGTSNCVVNMISADTYAEFILPCDIRLSKSFERFGIHSCNWIIDPYINEFNQVKNLGYIDLGSESDLVKVKKGFPNARRHVFYDPAFLIRKSEAEVKRDITRIYEELAPCDLTLPDIEINIPDEKIIWFVETADDIARG